MVCQKPFQFMFSYLLLIFRNVESTESEPERKFEGHCWGITRIATNSEKSSL